MTTTEPCQDRPEWRDSDHWPSCHCQECAAPINPPALTMAAFSEALAAAMRRDGGESETNR